MLLALTIANLKMLLRNRQALFYALVFPLIFVVVFGLFRLDRPTPITIAVMDHAQDEISQVLIDNLKGIERFKLQLETDEALARGKLADGKFGYLLVIPEGLARQVQQGPGGQGAALTLVYDRGDISAGIIISTISRFLDRMNLQLAQAPPLVELKAESALARQAGYFDFLLPGLVGMGVMNFAIIGIAVAMAQYREQKILKRILTIPLKVRTFFLAQIGAYLILSVVQAAVILAAGMVLFGGKMYGNYLWFFLLVVSGNIVFLNLGFIVGAYAKNVNSASGLGNLVALPMMFLSGVFFPKEGLPPVLATVVEYLPLSPLLDAMRGVALEAKPIWGYPWELAILGGWIVVTSVVAVRSFRFT
ncbi:MAG: ABC transporter permease [Chloroflexi bacterium]|nr:ABC transporter permease [Chloroflexota bacterium]